MILMREAMHHFPQISVIVPIFNVAAWLPDCLDSLLNQSFVD